MQFLNQYSSIEHTVWGKHSNSYLEAGESVSQPGSTISPLMALPHLCWCWCVGGSFMTAVEMMLSWHTAREQVMDCPWQKTRQETSLMTQSILGATLLGWSYSVRSKAWNGWSLYWGTRHPWIYSTKIPLQSYTNQAPCSLCCPNEIGRKQRNTTRGQGPEWNERSYASIWKIALQARRRAFTELRWECSTQKGQTVARPQ